MRRLWWWKWSVWACQHLLCNKNMVKADDVRFRVVLSCIFFSICCKVLIWPGTSYVVRQVYLGGKSFPLLPSDFTFRYPSVQSLPSLAMLCNLALWSLSLKGVLSQSERWNLEWKGHRHSRLIFACCSMTSSAMICWCVWVARVVPILLLFF